MLFIENIGKIVNNAFNLCKLNFKSIFTNKSLLLLILFFLTLSLFFPIIFFPYIDSGGTIILVSTFLPMFILLGWVSYNCRKSTLYQNMNITGMSKYQFYLGQIFTTFLLTFIIFIIVWTAIWILGLFNVFLLDWVWTDSGAGKINPFYHGAWVNIIYVAILSALLIFSFYFFINSFISNQKLYYVVITILISFGIIFDGSLNTNFAKPPWNHHYNFNNLVENKDYIYDSITKTYYITQENFDNFLLSQKINSEEYKNIIEISGGLFPQRIFIPTLFYPLYGVGQFATMAITHHALQDSCWDFDKVVKIVDDLNNYSDNETLQTYSYYFHDLNWYDWFVIDFSNDGWYWTMVIIQPYIMIVFFTISGLIISKFKNSKI